ncbi:uncharacterized protein [Temnothorax longispinosus]|uniref:uncharacterized protein n=1 Tax=Temnothorax longispinosus TaxID=300112 RepID=UPI003A9974A6
MPLDRSPPRGNDMGEKQTAGEGQHTLVTILDEANPAGASQIGLNTHSGSFRVHDNAFRAHNDSDDPGAQAYAIRAVKTCMFWRDHAKTWFTQTVHNIRSDELKFCLVVDNLDKESMLEIADIIEAPPAADKYQMLKDTLISRLTDSDKKRLKKLLTGGELGDRKPSHLLREMRCLTNNSVDEKLLQTLWLQRMPTRIQELLAVAEGVSLDKLAELADKAIERTLPSVSAVEAPSTASDPTLPSASKHCYYHKKFGKDARNCSQPCSWTKTKTTLAIKAPEESEN